MDNTIELRPGFDFLTMVEEWRDYLEVNTSLGVFPTGLISLLVSRHLTLFRASIITMGLDWDQLEGEVTVRTDIARAIEFGYFERPTREQVDLAWSDAFDDVCDDLDDIIELLDREGRLS